MDFIYLAFSGRSLKGAQSLATSEHCLSVGWKVVGDSDLNIFRPLIASIPSVEEEYLFHRDISPSSIIKGDPGCGLIFGVAQLVEAFFLPVYAHACSENMISAGKVCSFWIQL